MTLTPARRLQRYLASTRHLVGTGLAVAGLAAHFTGILGAYWLPIDLGLYAAGVLLTPVRTKTDVVTEQQQSQEELKTQLRMLVQSLRPDLTPALFTQVQHIEAQLLILLPSLAGQPGNADSFTVQQTISDYLPGIFRSYLNMPATVRTRVHPQLSKTPEAAVSEQLQLLSDTLDRASQNVVRGDADQLKREVRPATARFVNLSGP